MEENIPNWFRKAPVISLLIPPIFLFSNKKLFWPDYQSMFFYTLSHN